LAQHTSTTALLKTFTNTNLETKYLLENLPDSLMQQKPTVGRILLNAELYSAHPRQHIEQIKRALAAG
jgi:hypothetical protein